MLTQKIKEIHDSEHYGVIVEIGAGLPVSESLFEVSGASKTIYEVLSPYSREAQKELFGESTERVVSAEHTIKNIQTLIEKYSSNTKINFIYLSSFQLGDSGTTKSTHGWSAIAKVKNPSTRRGKPSNGGNMVVWDSWEVQIVHMSFHENTGRSYMIKNIADNCVPFLYNFLFSEDLPEGSTIDNLICGTIDVRENKIQKVSLQSAENEIKRVLMHMGTTGHVCVTPGGSMVRMETVFRDKEKIFLYKGSFKPVTLAHVKMAKSTGGDVVMAISIDTYEKGEQSIDSVLWRVRLLNKLGYTVMINRDGYFKSTARLFYNKFGKHVSFLVGSDTFNRIEDTGDFDKDYVLRECEFYIGIRPGSPLKKVFDFSKIHILGDFPDISATEIRKRKTNGDFDGVKEYMPEEVFADYLEIKE